VAVGEKAEEVVEAVNDKQRKQNLGSGNSSVKSEWRLNAFLFCVAFHSVFRITDHWRFRSDFRVLWLQRQ
jgi:hypothetical protein